ncbi:MAG: CDP-diacylglycerol-serine O-phosphatidyltransferase [candidate division TM6 bacterium GW2011_GWF2_37_49]|nr:MAG: CDP-diacylglycerol-serine O-phosphatidyltransferase [candidate division TM6 bacterium GW2011_GWF2_37_49]
MFSKNSDNAVKFQPRLKQKKTRFNKFKNIEFKKGLQIIPNIFTLGNALFGFCSIIFAAEGEFVASAYCIFFGSMMDSLDGQIARLFRTASSFGLQLDSLSDAITFCLAPAFLVYSWQLHKFGFLGLLICSSLLLFGVLRLAKFNITASDQTHYFIGVPTPIVACFFASIILNFGVVNPHFWGRVILGLLIFVCSGLMVATVRVPTFKHIRKELYVAAVAVFISVAVVFSLVKTLLLLFVAYFLFVVAKMLYIFVSNLLYKPLNEEDLHDSGHHLA